MTFRRGVLRLTDPAPPSSPKRLGFFRAEGIAVALRVEPSGRVSRTSFGAGGRPEKLAAPLAVSLNGNTPTLRIAGRSKRLQCRVSLRRRTRAAPPRIVAQPHRKAGLAIVHTLATHNLLLGYRLAAGGIGPDRDVVPTVMPPAETAAALREVRIDGCCAGAPSDDVAARRAWPHRRDLAHDLEPLPEKVLQFVKKLLRARPGSCTRFCARC